MPDDFYDIYRDTFSFVDPLEDRIREVKKEILLNPNSRNMNIFNLCNNNISYNDSIKNCFEGSTYILPSNEFPIAIGFQQVDLGLFNIWMAMADGIEKKVRYLAQFGRFACDWFSKIVHPHSVVGYADVHKSFEGGISYLKHWGFVQWHDWHDDAKLRMSRIFGE